MNIRRVGKVLLGLVLSVVLVLCGLVALAFWNYSQPPRVTLTNQTGGPISEVRIRVGDAEVNAGTVQDGRTIRRTVPFRGGEGSPEILWIDKAGMARQQNMNTYVEGRGGYQTTVVIDRNGRANLIMPNGDSHQELRVNGTR